VQRVRVRDRVAVHSQDVGVEAGRDTSLAVPEPDHGGRRRGDHAQRRGRPDPYGAQHGRRVPDHVVRLDRTDAGVAARHYQRPGLVHPPHVGHLERYSG